MPKYDYLKGLVASLSKKDLEAIVEGYAKKDQLFEAFVIEQSGQAVDTGKSFLDYQLELGKVLKKCTSRKGFVKFNRLKNAGVGSAQQMMLSHLKSENYGTALWLSLALMEVLQEAVLMNTRYRWANKPYKSFAKMLMECQQVFDSSYQFAQLERKKTRPAL